MKQKDCEFKTCLNYIVLEKGEIKKGRGVLCDKTSPGEKHTYLLTPDGKATTDQNTNAIKIQIGEPMDFMEVTHRNTGEGLLEE